MSSNTDFSKKQLATILSALDDALRSPANKGEALRAIGRSAKRLGLTTDDVLAAAPGLLDGRLSPAEFRAELRDLGDTAPVPVTDALQGAPDAQGGNTAGEEPQASAEPAPAAGAPAATEPGGSAADKQATSPDTAVTRTPREGTKQALMIELLRRPEGATGEQIAEATGWQKHTIRGAISGALKKKLGLTVETIRTRAVGPNKAGGKGSSTIYRIPGPATGTEPTNGSGTETA